MANVFPIPIPVTLASLTSAPTPDDNLSLSLSIASALGLPTTAWQSIQMIPAVININATLASDNAGVVALLAEGAYASTAAQMVDAGGNPVTVWLDLRLSDQYNLTRFSSSFASGPVPYTNPGAGSYPYAPNNPLHAQNQVTGATYTSTGTGTVAPGTGTIAFQADQPGSASTSGAGTVLTLTTPLAGVSLTALTTSLVGSDAETNAAALLRGQNKLATLAPILPGEPSPVSGGASGAYDYVAKSIPQAASASAVPPYAVTSPITRTASAIGAGTGLVTVYLANAAGAPSPTDVAVVDAALQALVTPDCVAVNAVAATPAAFTIVTVVYVKSSAGLTAAQIITAVDDALALYFSNVPIGGVSTTTPNIVPLSEIVGTIFDANRGTLDVIMGNPTASISIGANSVATLSSTTVTVVFR